MPTLLWVAYLRSGWIEAAEGCDSSVEAILARHGKQRLHSKEFGDQFASLPTSHQD